MASRTRTKKTELPSVEAVMIGGEKIRIDPETIAAGLANGLALHHKLREVITDLVNVLDSNPGVFCTMKLNYLRKSHQEFAEAQENQKKVLEAMAAKA